MAVDVQQWIIDLLAPSIGLTVAGVLVLITLIELITRLKEWLS